MNVGNLGLLRAFFSQEVGTVYRERIGEWIRCALRLSPALGSDLGGLSEKMLAGSSRQEHLP